MLVLVFSAELNLLPSGGRMPYRRAPDTASSFPERMIAGRNRSDRAGGEASRASRQRHSRSPCLESSPASRVRRSSMSASRNLFSRRSPKGSRYARSSARHLAPNAAVPIITIIGLELGSLLSGSIIVEVVFSWPGLGTLLFQAVSVRDIPLVLGIVMTYTSIFILLNTVIDLLYVWIDPRIRLQGAA